MPTNPGISEVQDKNGVVADIEAKRFDGTRTVNIQGDITATQTWNGDSNTALTLNASIGAKKVTQDKIGDKAVGTGQMADGSVGLTQMAASAMTDTVSANNSKLVTSQGVNAAIAAATLNRGKDYGPLSVDEINAISETIPTGSTVYVESLGASDAKVINDGYSDGTMASFSVEVGEDLKYYRSPDNSLHGWYSTEANVKIKQPANYSGGIAVDSAQDASSGSAGIEFIQSFKQNTNGDIRDIVKAQVDIVDSTSSTRTNAAATPNSVKSAYDLANTANTGLANKLDKTGDGKDVTATFTEASARANIGTGEKLSVMFGKIKKWFTDLKALAFKDTVSDSDISGTISDNHIASASTWNGKADKVSGATNGDLAELDSNGNLTDSGKKTSDFEQVTNKVTSWQSTPDNTHYPSEKLVKDDLDAKADANKVVAIADAQIVRSIATSNNWLKAISHTHTASNSNIIGVWKISFVEEAASHIAYEATLIVNVRSNGSGQQPTIYNAFLKTESDYSLYSVCVETVGVAGNVDVNVYFNVPSYGAIMIKCLSNGARDLSFDKNFWTYTSYGTSVTGVAKPVTDESTNTKVKDVLVSKVQYNIASPTNDNLVAMDENGLIKDSGVAVLPSTSTWDGTSDAKVPTAKAVQAKLDAISTAASAEAEVTAAALDDIDARMQSVEDAVNSDNIGDKIADSLDAQVLRVGGQDVVANIEYVAAQSGGGGDLMKTVAGTQTSVLRFMNDSEAVSIWNDAKQAAANAS